MKEQPQQTIARGATTAFGAQLMSSAFALLGTLVVSRALGPDGRGQMAVALAASTSFWAMCQLSLEFSNTYFFAQKLADLRTIARLTSSAALLVAPVALALQLVFFVATRDSVFSGVETAAALIAAATVPISIHLNWLMNLYQLGARLVRSQLALVVGAALQFIGIIVLALLGQITVVSALLLYAANVIGAWLLHLVWGRSFLSITPVLEPSRIRRIMVYGLRLHPSFLFWFLLLRVDILLVNVLLSTVEAGLYSIATIVAETVLLLSLPIAAAVLPVQSAQGIQQAAGVTFKAVRFNCLLTASLSLTFAASMWLLIPMVFGEGFAPAYGPMLTLLPGMIAMGAYRPLYTWLVREQRARRLAAISGLAFVANVVLNIMLLPTLGTIGAGLASSLAYTGLTAALVVWGLRLGEVSARDALLFQRADVDTLRRHARLICGAFCRRRTWSRHTGS